MTEHFILPDRLDSSAAPKLVEALRVRMGKPLTLDASRVEVIGTLAVEVIISAGLQWTADGRPLKIADPSERFESAFHALGLRADAPWHGATAGAA